MAKKDDLQVFIASRDVTCDECGEELGRKAWITLVGDKGALCLSCADLDHLVFLPAGDAALTRRSRKYSKLCAVVLKWSRARKRYERQGLLVEDAALAQAESECLADEQAREKRRQRDAARRAELDQAYVQRFAERIRQLYPHCPENVETTIAEHACLKYSGRVGRTAAAKSLAEEFVQLAVIAHVRHEETSYDEFLSTGWERREARAQVRPQVESVLARWKKGRMKDSYHIRLAQEADLPALSDIERRAAALFEDLGLTETFAALLTPGELFREGWEKQQLWVAEDAQGGLLGFALAGVVAGNAHLDELDVLPEYGRQGIGSALVETVCQWARQAGFQAVTLTTLSQIPWNAPFYARLGFRILQPNETPTALRGLLQSEIARGLPGQNRVVMQREL